MITDRNLELGMKLTAKFKKQTYAAEVVEAERDDVSGSKDEGLRIRLEDGRIFRSVSSAAGAITGGSINGWRFWSLAGAETTENKAAKKKAEVAESDAADGGQVPWMKKLEKDMAPAPDAQPEPEAPKPVKKVRKAPAKESAVPKSTKTAKATKAK